MSSMRCWRGASGIWDQLHGIPIAHKDCILTKGVRTTGGSKIYRDYVPERDAEAVTRLHAGGRGGDRQDWAARVHSGISNVNPHFGAGV